MAQITIYMPDDLADKLKREAKRSGLSLSGLLTDMAKSRMRRTRWPASFTKVLGKGLVDFPEIEDPPAEELDDL